MYQVQKAAIFARGINNLFVYATCIVSVGSKGAKTRGAKRGIRGESLSTPLKKCTGITEKRANCYYPVFRYYG